MKKARLSQPSRDALKRQVQILEAKNRELARTLQIIEEARSYLADQYDFAPIGFVTLDAKGCIRDINLTAARLLGQQRSPLLGMPFLTCISKPSSRMFLQHLRECRSCDSEVACELELRLKSRRSLQVELRSVPVTDPRHKDTVYRTAITDITERMRAIKALKESEKRYQVVDLSPDGIFILIQGDIVFANRAAVGLCGEEKVNDLIGRKLVDMARPQYRQARIADFLATSHPDTPMEVRLGAEAMPTQVEIATREFNYDGEDAMLVIARDITLRRQAEQQVLSISEREKTRLGQDLHDGLCQSLTGAACLAEGLRKQLSRLHPPAAQEVEEIVRVVRQCIHEAHGLAKGLYPVMMETHGFIAALQALAEEVSKRTGVACSVQCDEAISVADLGTATNLYRIAQEAIGNSIKHGGAKMVRVRLNQNGSAVVLAVQDDGCGFPDHPQESGMGLYTMRYRAAMIGGSLEICRVGEGGTLVTCTFPYQGAGK